MTTTSQTLSALRTLGYSAEKLADLITDGIADADARAQVREVCLRELAWVDTLLTSDDLRITDAEREAVGRLACACETSAILRDPEMAATLRGLLERTK